MIRLRRGSINERKWWLALGIVQVLFFGSMFATAVHGRVWLLVVAFGAGTLAGIVLVMRALVR